MLPVAFVPSTPLLHPEIAGSAAEATAATRDAARMAMTALLPRPTVVVLGGLGVGGRPPARAQLDTLRPWPADADDCLREFGLPDPVGSGPEPVAGGTQGRSHDARADATKERLPLSLSLGRWLLRDADFAGNIGLISVDGSPADVTAASRQLELSPDCGLLVVGDGTATRSDKAPGHLVSGAIEFDNRLAEAFQSADMSVFNNLPAAADIEFLLDGRCAWQAAMTVCGHFGAPDTSELLAFEAPHGVAYFVAAWLVRESMEPGVFQSAPTAQTAQ